MTLYYAIGGGWGHLVRATALIHTLQRNGAIDREQHFLILHNASLPSQYLYSPPNTTLQQIPHEALASVQSCTNFLRQLIKDLPIEAIYIDTFPIGVRYELSFLSSQQIPLTLVARILKQKYFDQMPCDLSFQQIFEVEPLPAYQREYLKHQSNHIQSIQLQYPSPVITPPLDVPPNTWLIVHSGPKDEVRQLYIFAIEKAEIMGAQPNILIITDQAIKIEDDDPYHTRCIRYFPAHALFAQAEKIFTACGYNSMQQCQAFRDRHHYLPMQRRHDDQYLRAKMMRNNAASA